jgi:hypothetical protein
MIICPRQVEGKSKEKTMKKNFASLKSLKEKESDPNLDPEPDPFSEVLIHGSVSGTAPKCHGSQTLLKNQQSFLVRSRNIHF